MALYFIEIGRVFDLILIYSSPDVPLFIACHKIMNSTWNYSLWGSEFHQSCKIITINVAIIIIITIIKIIIVIIIIRSIL